MCTVNETAVFCIYTSMQQPILIMNKDNLAWYADESCTKTVSLKKPSINVLYSRIEQLNLAMSNTQSLLCYIYIYIYIHDPLSVYCKWDPVSLFCIYIYIYLYIYYKYLSYDDLIDMTQTDRLILTIKVLIEVRWRQRTIWLIWPRARYAPRSYRPWLLYEPISPADITNY